MLVLHVGLEKSVVWNCSVVPRSSYHLAITAFVLIFKSLFACNEKLNSFTKVNTFFE